MWTEPSLSIAIKLMHYHYIYTARLRIQFQVRGPMECREDTVSYSYFHEHFFASMQIMIIIMDFYLEGLYGNSQIKCCS